MTDLNLEIMESVIGFPPTARRPNPLPATNVLISMQIEANSRRVCEAVAVKRIGSAWSMNQRPAYNDYEVCFW